MEYFEQKFQARDFRQKPLKVGVFEQCSFIDCDFNSVNLDNFRFIDCAFIRCDLSNASLHKTGLVKAIFQDCKLLGLHFEDCADFGFAVKYTTCQMDHCSFYEMKVQNTQFTRCTLRGVDFTRANLSKTSFSASDLADAKFDRSNLEGADFREAVNFRIDPEANNIRGAHFNLDGLPGLLEKYKIHCSP